MPEFDTAQERLMTSLREKFWLLGKMEDGTEEEQLIPVGKENAFASNLQQSPYLDRVKAGRASRRESKADSTATTIFGDLPAELSGTHTPQEYISDRFAELESRLEDYLDSVAEEVAQDLEREQKHLILMQEQVDKQGQMLNREITALHKKLEGETVRRSFVTSEARGTKEALAEQLEQQSKELAFLRARVEELETPVFVRSIRRVFAGWLAGCSPTTPQPLPLSHRPQEKPKQKHTGELEPVLPVKMES